MFGFENEIAHNRCCAHGQNGLKFEIVTQVRFLIDHLAYWWSQYQKDMFIQVTLRTSKAREQPLTNGVQENVRISPYNACLLVLSKVIHIGYFSIENTLLVFGRKWFALKIITSQSTILFSASSKQPEPTLQFLKHVMIAAFRDESRLSLCGKLILKHEIYRFTIDSPSNCIFERPIVSLVRLQSFHWLRSSALRGICV